MTEEELRRTITPRYWASLYSPSKPRYYRRIQDITLDDSLSFATDMPDDFIGHSDVLVAAYSFGSNIDVRLSLIAIDIQSKGVSFIPRLSTAYNDIDCIDRIWELTSDGVKLDDAIRLLEFME